VRPLTAIVAKDIAIEWRKKESFSSMLLFGLLVVVTSSFAFAAVVDDFTRNLVAAGILWIAFSFAGILGLNRSLSIETDNDCLQGLLLAPLTRGDLYLGKVASNLAFTLTAEVFILPVFLIVNNLAFDLRAVWLLGLTILGTLAFVSIGTTLSMISAHTSMKEVMLPILQIPMTLPVVIVAVEATSMVLRRETEQMSFPLSLLGVFSTVYLTASYFVFEYIVEE
jgi:heme exporter protein B